MIVKKYFTEQCMDKRENIKVSVVISFITADFFTIKRVELSSIIVCKYIGML